MLNIRIKTTLASFAILILSAFLVDEVQSFPIQDTGGDEKVSRFGEYDGYSTKRFEHWVVDSRYVEMRDGVKLAVDVVRPSVDGTTPVDEQVPVVWTHSRYHRNQKAMAPRLESMVDGRPDLQSLVTHGYAIASVGVRGSGASFGRFEGLFSPNETEDAYEIVEWLSNQSWCDGNVGMFGGSYLGMTQYMAASKGHPSLKAIFPNVAGFDMYDVLYPGGVFRRDMIQHWDELTRMLDTQMRAAPVHTDPNGELLDQAIAGHGENWEVLKGYQKAKFRDSRTTDHSYFTHNPAPFLEAINQASVPAYHWNGFHDIFVTDATLWFANYAGPQKLGIGPWAHSVFPDQRFMAERMRLQAIEQHRWFDYWLKGIDNGIMDEPPVNYAILDEEKEWIWTSDMAWPPAASKPVTFYFSGDRSGSIDSINDGTLQQELPGDSHPSAVYTVDLTTTTGKASRWDNAVGQGALRYGDMSDNDRKSLTFTTPALDHDLTITGHPVVTLFICCSAEDCDFHVLLEEVDESGKSIYVTEGVLRASQRTQSEAPWNNLGLPYQRCYEEDQTPLKIGAITELNLDLHPTSTVFNSGHRLRVSVMCADQDNTQPLEIAENAEVTLFHNTNRPSHISLPVFTPQDR